MASAIRIGIVGAGDNTRVRHIPGLQAQEGVEIVSVCNRSQASSQRVAREFGIPTTHGHWRELIASDGIDAVVIGTWPYLHCPITLAALEAGKHVMTEARMAMDAGQARRMLEEVSGQPSPGHPDRSLSHHPAGGWHDPETGGRRIPGRDPGGGRHQQLQHLRGSIQPAALAPRSQPERLEHSGHGDLV